MSKQHVLRAVAAVVLAVLGGLLLFVTSALLFNDSWRSTMDALGPPHAILEYQVVFALGLCCMALAVFFFVRQFLPQRRKV